MKPGCAFFLAVAGLVLAFTAAVFSSAARESGNLLATAIFASTALFLAGLVGVTTVPFLARRVAAGRVREALQYELTREGMAYLGVALVIGIAALNTGNNLLFIILAAMLAAIVVSGVAQRRCCAGLDLDIMVPRNAFAAKPVGVRVELHNPRLMVPAFSIKVHTPVDKKRKNAGMGVAKNRIHFSRRRKWLRLPDYTLTKKVSTTAPGQSADASGVLHVHRPTPYRNSGSGVDVPARGMYSQNSFSVATRFPFSFLINDAARSNWSANCWCIPRCWIQTICWTCCP